MSFFGANAAAGGRHLPNAAFHHGASAAPHHGTTQHPTTLPMNFSTGRAAPTCLLTGTCHNHLITMSVVGGSDRI
jgi:hypothetical protein